MTLAPNTTNDSKKLLYVTLDYHELLAAHRVLGVLQCVAGVIPGNEALLNRCISLRGTMETCNRVHITAKGSQVYVTLDMAQHKELMDLLYIAYEVACAACTPRGNSELDAGNIDHILGLCAKTIEF